MKRTSSPDRLTFLGAAGTVTGSKYLLELGDERILLDCGLFQGLKALRLRNWAEPAFDPRAIGCVVLSHAHVDHSGYLPLLARKGFRGPVHCTPATADLLRVVLRDAAHLQEEDARRANRYGYTRHHPALPLYSVEDAEQVLEQLRPLPYGQHLGVAGATTALFRRAGHILGSATVEISRAGAEPWRLVFSGDLGRWGRPILRDPDFVSEADVLLIESTYGDRVHPTDPDEHLVKVITDTARRGGMLLVPAFAIGRTQELIWTIRKLEDAGRLPPMPLFLDSPMAIDVTDIYCRHSEEHDLDMQALTDAKRCPLSGRDHHLLRTPDQSRALNDHLGPAIVIAGSGMATGGRILHHLEHRLPDPKNTVLLVGFQAAGTRGRALRDGAREIRMHGRMIPVRAHVEALDGLSAHADRNDLLRWLRAFRKPPRHTYVVHGEEAAARSLADAIRTDLGWKATVAEHGASVSMHATPASPQPAR